MSSFESDVTALFANLRSLTQESAYGATLSKVLDMQEQLVELSSARKLDARELRIAEADIQKLEKEVGQQKDQIASLSTALQESESKLADAKVQLESERKESREAFSLATTELEAKSQKLEELESYTSKLRSVSSLNVAPAFTKLFHQAFTIARKHFAKDVEDIAGNGLWGTFGNHPAVEDKIPLPLNNSKAAQQMRTAAFLAILSSELSTFVFQPSYALEFDEIADFLHGVASRNPALEAHLRSVLLRAQPETERKSEAEQRANVAAQEVIRYLKGMLNEQDEGQLYSELGTLCSQASKLWQTIQTLDRSFITVMKLDGIPDPRSWKILDFSEGPAQEASSRDQQSRDTSSTRGGKAKAAADPVPVAERVIWPSLIIGGPTDEIVAAGYALSDSQMSAARAEKTKSPHRDTRSRQRARSIAEHAGGSRFGSSFQRRDGRA